MWDSCGVCDRRDRNGPFGAQKLRQLGIARVWYDESDQVAMRRGIATNHRGVNIEYKFMREGDCKADLIDVGGLYRWGRTSAVSHFGRMHKTLPK